MEEKPETIETFMVKLQTLIKNPFMQMLPYRHVCIMQELLNFPMLKPQPQPLPLSLPSKEVSEELLKFPMLKPQPPKEVSEEYIRIGETDEYVQMLQSYYKYNDIKSDYLISASYSSLIEFATEYFHDNPIEVDGILYNKVKIPFNLCKFDEKCKRPDCHFGHTNKHVYNIKYKTV